MWLVIGGDSEIGSAVEKRLSERNLAVRSTTRRAGQLASNRIYLDLSQSLSGWRPPPGTESVCICAAVARLAACASDPQASTRINVTQTLALAEQLVQAGVYVLFLSTNQVFDGRTRDVAADAPVSPVSEYGRQKARTETALLEHSARGARIAILRLAKVVSPNMPLIQGWVDALRAGEEIRAFHDMTMAPTPIERVIDAIGSLMRDKASGIFQLTGPKDETYADVARYVARSIGADEALVKAVNASSIGLPEGSTPRFTTLNSNTLRERYNIVSPGPWKVVDSILAAKT